MGLILTNANCDVDVWTRWWEKSDDVGANFQRDALLVAVAALPSSVVAVVAVVAGGR